MRRKSAALRRPFRTMSGYRTNPNRPPTVAVENIPWVFDGRKVNGKIKRFVNERIREAKIGSEGGRGGGGRSGSEMSR